MRRLVLIAAVLATTLPAAALADHSVTEVVSVASNGVDPATLLPSGGFTADGNHVVLATAERLDPADTDSSKDVYLRSFVADTTRLLSIGPAGGNGAFDAEVAAMSDNGSRVMFTTSEPLVPGDTDASRDLYERAGTATTLVSTGPAGGNGPHDVLSARVSPDGAHVFFETNEQLVAADTFSGRDIYERFAGVTALVSTGPAGGACAAGFECFDAVSSDGTRVIFKTTRALTSADTDTQYDVYVRTAGTTTLLTPGAGPYPAFRTGNSADATKVSFHTDEQLVAADTDSLRDAYLNDGGTVSLISTGPSPGPDAAAGSAGVARDGSRSWFVTTQQMTADDADGGKSDIYERRGSTTRLITRNTPGRTHPYYDDPSFLGASSDGERVFFLTENPLTPDDTDPPGGCTEDVDGDYFSRGCRDVYVFDSITDSISLVSTGPGAGGAYDVEIGATEISADGTRVVFITREPILGQDAPGCFGGCTDIYERTLGTTPQTFLLTQGPTGGFGIGEVFGADIEYGVGGSVDKRRYYFYADEALTSADSDTAFDLYVSAVAEPGGYPRPKGATPLFASLVPASAPCTAPNRTHGPPLAFASCAPPQPSSPNLTVGGSAGASPARSSGYVRFHAPFDTPGPPDGADVSVTVVLTNVMRSSDFSDYTGELRATASIRMTNRDSGAPSTIQDFPLSVTVPCAATVDTTLGATCSVETTFDSVVPGLAPEGMRSVYEMGQVRVHDGGPDENADTPGDNSPFAVQGVFVP